MTEQTVWIEGEEAFDVQDAHAAVQTFTEIEAACRDRDTVAYKYLIELKEESIKAGLALAVVDPEKTPRIRELQATMQRYIHFCDWIIEKLSLGYEAALRLEDFKPEFDVTPEFADRDQPQEEDNGTSDD